MKTTTLSLILVLLVSACASKAQDVPTANPAIEKLTAAKEGALACIMYADAHGGQFPTNLPATAGYANTNYLNQLTANFDLVYTGAITKIAKPSDTIILKEKKAWQSLRDGKLGKAKAYAFADGHAEMYWSEDGNFSKWEAERIIKP
ncbi:MAG: hypothetical protein ACXWJB_13845 [Limisphaerales bacterium]